MTNHQSTTGNYIGQRVLSRRRDRALFVAFAVASGEVQGISTYAMFCLTTCLAAGDGGGEPGPASVNAAGSIAFMAGNRTAYTQHRTLCTIGCLACCSDPTHTDKWRTKGRGSGWQPCPVPVCRGLGWGGSVRAMVGSSPHCGVDARVS